MAKKEKKEQTNIFKGKISKYGFIHLKKAVREMLKLPEKQDVPVTLNVNADKRSITVKIQ